MVEILSGLKHKVGDVCLHMTADTTASLEHWKDALVHFMKHVAQVEDQYKLAQEQAKPKTEQPPLPTGEIQTPLAEEPTKAS